MLADSLKWRKTKPLLDENVISQLEQTFGVKFSLDFADCFRKYHGAYMAEYEFQYEEPELGPASSATSRMLDVNGEEFWDIVLVNKEWQFPNGLVAIIRDVSGNFICLDYRTVGLLNEPQIAYCSLDTGLDDPFIFLARNFQEFILKLKAGKNP